MLCADCESSLYIGCYAEIVSRHFTLYVVRRVWVVTLRCMLCAESESSLYIVCYVQNSQGSMVNAMAFPAGPEPENQRRLELSPHHPAWDRSGCILFGLYIFSRSRRNINLLMYMPSGTKHSGGQPVYMQLYVDKWWSALVRGLFFWLIFIFLQNYILLALNYQVVVIFSYRNDITIIVKN